MKRWHYVLIYLTMAVAVALFVLLVWGIHTTTNCTFHEGTWWCGNWEQA